MSSSLQVEIDDGTLLTFNKNQKHGQIWWWYCGRMKVSETQIDTELCGSQASFTVAHRGITLSW